MAGLGSNPCSLMYLQRASKVVPNPSLLNGLIRTDVLVSTRSVSFFKFKPICSGTKSNVEKSLNS